MTASTNETEHPRTSRSVGDSYYNIEPWFDKLAALDPTDPEHARTRAHIIDLCLPLAANIARKFNNRGEALDDLLQIARVGLVLAVDRYDTAHGASFLSFAIPTIMGEVRRYFRDHTWSVRVPRATKELQQRLGPVTETLTQRLGRGPTAREIAAELDVEVTEVTRALIARNAYRANSLDNTGGQDDDVSAASVLDTLGAHEPSYRLIEDRMAVRPLLAALPEHERQILAWRFFDQLTQAQIAERIGVSQMQVSRILNRVLSGLREQALAESPTNRKAATA